MGKIHESRIAARSSDEELLDVHEALEELAQVNEVAANLVKLRYFAGMSLIEAAAALDLAQRSAERLWTFSRSWLRDALVKKNSST